MAYVKNYPGGWQNVPAITTPVTAATLDNIETQYAEAIAVSVLKSLYDAHSLLIAIADNTPVVLPVAASRIVGRKAAGNIVALTGAEIRTILGWTADKILKGAGAGVAPTEIDPPLTFTELAGGEAHTVAGAGAWEDWDISAIIPAGAVYALIGIVNHAINTLHTGGARKNGTALARTFLVGWGAYAVQTHILTECDANRIIDIYATNAGDIDFSVLGYWS